MAEEIGVARHLKSRKGWSPGCFPVWLVMTDVEEGAMVGDSDTAARAIHGGLVRLRTEAVSSIEERACESHV
jgi:hypothetical protein